MLIQFWLFCIFNALRCLIFLGREKRGDNLWSVGTSRCRPTCCWSLMEDSYLCQSPHIVNLGRVSAHPRSPLQRSTQAGCAHPRVPIGAQRGRQRIWICGSPGVARHTQSCGSPRDVSPNLTPLQTLRVVLVVRGLRGSS
jgi:hypothetical protein